MDDLDQLQTDLLADVGVADLAALEALRVSALGKSGSITEMVKGIGQLPTEKRRDAGQKLNAIKSAVSAAIDARKNALEVAALDAVLSDDHIDITLPTRPEQEGRIHPISQTIDEMVAIFCAMGFTVAEGPHIESDFNNFTALNIPPEHPARQDHDTFYLPPDQEGHRKVLRTHTSPVQIRTMINRKPPIRIVVPGRTFRADHDATHSPMFHQIEGLVIDEATHMGHLKGCLIEFCRAFFDVENLPVRFRPSYFPFTEPSAEVDIGCSREGGGLTIGAGADWLEILGCGMVNPRVLENCGIDSTKYQGFAFGMGIERAAMLKYGIPDLRTLYESDVRWLKHYGFGPLDVPNLTEGLVR
jgi:phenylalanyl-tRNA synthetase alpha chain